jgi:hypothetical protein
MVFIGTESGGLLGGVGVILVLWGAYRLYQKRQA